MKAKEAKAKATKTTISPATLDILKNAALINQTLLFPQGSTLITRSVKKHTYLEAGVAESFPKRFTIYDLNPFLAVLTQLEKPELVFDESDDYVRISNAEGGLSVKYHYGDEALAYVPDPTKKVELPSTEVNLKLTEASFRQITNMARTLGTPELALESDGKQLTLVTMDSKNSSTNTTSLPIGEAPDKTPFSFVWKIEYLKLIPGNYDVSVCKAGLSRFKHMDSPITYHIVLEANSSKYGD
jgi:hypothetical protein